MIKTVYNTKTGLKFYTERDGFREKVRIKKDRKELCVSILGNLLLGDSRPKVDIRNL